VVSYRFIPVGWVFFSAGGGACPARFYFDH
jgi:hypothetical protein